MRRLGAMHCVLLQVSAQVEILRHAGESSMDVCPLPEHFSPTTKCPEPSRHLGLFIAKKLFPRKIFWCAKIARLPRGVTSFM